MRLIAFAVFGNWAAVSEQWDKGAYTNGIFTVGQAIFAAAAVLTLVYQQLNRRSRGFYFAWARFLNWLRPGRSPTWDVQARLAGSAPQEV
ncbi:MAG: hypothetical protein IH863_05615, partial [Chloroflexi bacterium]|nr:hypothetical protein [Chloroflexota bacterium]